MININAGKKNPENLEILGVKSRDFRGSYNPTRGTDPVVFKMSRVGSGRVRKYSKFHGSGQVGSIKRISNIMGRVRSGQEFFKSHGSGRMGSIIFQISLVGSGRVKR